MAIPEHAKMVFKGKNFDVYQWEQEMFDGSKKIFEKLKRNDAIDIIAISEDKKILILEEEQPGRDPFYGLVGGTCEDGEEPLETAKRELLEETGLISDDWELFRSSQKSSRIEHYDHLFIARNCKKVKEQNLDSGEKIKIRIVDWNELLKILADPKFRVKNFALEVFTQIFLGQEESIKNMILK
ncbi:MAG: NUDIX hydrolase [Candidatus Gracilibacteria bacterium]|nr:NUDIX hydrolase [Candidatus Gracilibacteria bacterium]